VPKLLNRRCAALVDRPMDATEIGLHLGQVSGWKLADGAIEKAHNFENFHQTMAFVNAVAWICHVQDHHPDIALSYGRCVLRFSTHSVGGVSINDFICAAKVDALLPDGG
jgi:4a-hydroxytetrahydrobiopterin dehydratase